MAKASIFIVDDNPVNLTVLRTLLSRENYDVVATDCGTSALEIVRSNPNFDLIMLDVMMPDMNGIEVCRKLKQDPDTAHIPIILVSALRTDEGSMREGLEAGAEGYLTQPIEDTALRAWVRATLRISSLQKQLADQTEGEGLKNVNKTLESFSKLSHKVNNPLQALYAATDLLALELPEDSPGHQLINEILDNAERVAKMVAEASLTAKRSMRS